MKTPAKCQKICFCHYGIGWRDGVNVVLRNLTGGLKKRCPSLDIFLLGGEIKEKILEEAHYKTIPELLPTKKKITKSQLKEQSVIIAKKLARQTKEIDTLIIENPFMGGYHLSAMLGYWLYAKDYKPQSTKLFFRVHDYFRDSKKYSNKVKKIFSPKEIKKIINNEKVDGFFVINHSLKEKLIKEGISPKKIFYLPNPIDKTLFARALTRKEEKLLRKRLLIPIEAKILLYPARVVPRKNIEEAILLTYFLRKMTGENYALVISGKVDRHDPEGAEYYQRLKKLTEKLDFPVIFTKGLLPTEREYDYTGRIKQFSIGDLYKSSQAIITTSQKEGFGYPFLECWLARKIVVGRWLRDVISDFEQSGLNFNWLYHRFFVDEQKTDLAEIENGKNFKRIEKVKNIFNNKKTLEKLFELNKISLIKTIKVLQDKKSQKEIIKKNLERVRKVYEISKVTEQFLKLVRIK